MDTKKIERLAGQSEIMQKFARNIRQAVSRDFLPHIGGRVEGSSHASTDQVDTINCPLMPQAARDQIAGAFETAAGILNQHIKTECDKPLEDDPHTIAAKAIESLRKEDS